MKKKITIGVILILGLCLVYSLISLKNVRDDIVTQEEENSRLHFKLLATEYKVESLENELIDQKTENREIRLRSYFIYDEAFVNNPIDRYFGQLSSKAIHQAAYVMRNVSSFQKAFWEKELDHVNELILHETEGKIRDEYIDYYQDTIKWIGQRVEISALENCGYTDIDGEHVFGCGTAYSYTFSSAGIKLYKAEVFYLYNRFELDYDFQFNEVLGEDIDSIDIMELLDSLSKKHFADDNQ